MDARDSQHFQRDGERASVERQKTRTANCVSGWLYAGHGFDWVFLTGR